ncbi:MAG: bactofilin family protein [Bacillota bacterium]
MFKKGSMETMRDKVDTIIGKDTFFSGNINGKGVIRIDGEIEGSVQDKGDVIIGENGKVAAELKARNITIAGLYEGTLEAEGKLELKKTATAVGTFKANGLIIEEGAVFSGSMEMQQKQQAIENKAEDKPLQKRDWSYKPLSPDSSGHGARNNVKNEKSVSEKT